MLHRFRTVCLIIATSRIRHQLLLISYCVWALIFAAVGSSAAAQSESAGSVAATNERAAIEIITVENRDPAFVRAAIRPILDPRGSISQVDNKLIVATTASNLQQIKTLIEQTDLPARRLVVSVDFDHGSSSMVSGSTSLATQQSVQAVEGDTVAFVQAPDSASVPQLTVKASIQSNLADTEIVISNVPGFTGLHRIQLSLGEWYVINPEESPEEVIESMLDGASAEIPGQPADDLLLSQFVTQVPPVVNQPVRQAPIAVRVDVLP